MTVLRPVLILLAFSFCTQGTAFAEVLVTPRIRGERMFTEVGGTLTLSVEPPVPGRWTCSDPKILAPGAKPGVFLARARGSVEVHFSHGTGTVSLTVAVRADPTEWICRPLRHDRTEYDPLVGCKVVSDEVFVRFRPDVPRLEQYRILAAFGFMVEGEGPGRFLTIACHPSGWPTRYAVMTRLFADPRVAAVDVSPVGGPQ